MTQAGKGVFPMIPAHALEKNTRNLYRFFSSFFKRKYVDTFVYTVACTVVFVGPAGFVFNAYEGRNTTCPLFSCSNKNNGHAVALTVFLRLLVKDPFV